MVGESLPYDASDKPPQEPPEQGLLFSNDQDEWWETLQSPATPETESLSTTKIRLLEGLDLTIKILNQEVHRDIELLRQDDIYQDQDKVVALYDIYRQRTANLIGLIEMVSAYNGGLSVFEADPEQGVRVQRFQNCSYDVWSHHFIGFPGGRPFTVNQILPDYRAQDNLS